MCIWIIGDKTIPYHSRKLFSTSKFLYLRWKINCKKWNIPWPNLLTNFSTNNLIFLSWKNTLQEIKQFVTKVINWFFSISTFIYLYWKTECERWNSPLPTPLTIRFNNHHHFLAIRDNTHSFQYSLAYPFPEIQSSCLLSLETAGET